jgi:hypothetical protein
LWLRVEAEPVVVVEQVVVLEVVLEGSAQEQVFQ